MGLFDFLLAKRKQEPALTPNAVPYLGDLNKTNSLYTMVQVPQAKRDAGWEKSFLENVSGASFGVGTHKYNWAQMGFPTFSFSCPNPTKAFSVM